MDYWNMHRDVHLVLKQVCGSRCWRLMDSRDKCTSHLQAAWSAMNVPSIMHKWWACHLLSSAQEETGVVCQMLLWGVKKLLDTCTVFCVIKCWWQVCSKILRECMCKLSRLECHLLVNLKLFAVVLNAIWQSHILLTLVNILLYYCE